MCCEIRDLQIQSAQCQRSPFKEFHHKVLLYKRAAVQFLKREENISYSKAHAGRNVWLGWVVVVLCLGEAYIDNLRIVEPGSYLSPESS